MKCVATRFVRFEADAVPAGLAADARAIAAATLERPGLECTHRAEDGAHTVTFEFATSPTADHDPRVFAAAVEAAAAAVDCTRPEFTLLAALARCKACAQLVAGESTMARCAACAPKAALACPPIAEEDIV